MSRFKYPAMSFQESRRSSEWVRDDSLISLDRLVRLLDLNPRCSIPQRAALRGKQGAAVCYSLPVATVYSNLGGRSMRRPGRDPPLQLFRRSVCRKLVGHEELPSESSWHWPSLSA